MVWVVCHVGAPEMVYSAPAMTIQTFVAFYVMLVIPEDYRNGAAKVSAGQRP